MIPPQGQPPHPPRAPHDSIGSGAALALLWQFVFIVVIPGMSLMLLWGFPRQFMVYSFFYWGLIQWIALIPLYFMKRNSGRQLAAKGILIAGCIGFLLNAGCYALIGRAFLSYYSA